MFSNVRLALVAIGLVTMLAGSVLAPSLASAEPKSSGTHTNIVRTRTIYRVVPSYSDELPPDTGINGGPYRGGPCYRCW
jgi:hypothetical protein